jgi:hypothetical protein
VYFANSQQLAVQVAQLSRNAHGSIVVEAILPPPDYIEIPGC